MVDFNLVTVLLAAVAAFVIGAVWHGPLFGKQWMKFMKFTPAEIKKLESQKMSDMAPTMLLAFGQQFVAAAALYVLATKLGKSGPSDALMLSSFIWFAFIVTSQLNTVLWEKRETNFFLFVCAYHWVRLAAVSLIVVLWQ